jgi:hypothetical protein
MSALILSSTSSRAWIGHGRQRATNHVCSTVFILEISDVHCSAGKALGARTKMISMEYHPPSLPVVKQSGRLTVTRHALSLTTSSRTPFTLGSSLNSSPQISYCPHLASAVTTRQRLPRLISIHSSRHVSNLAQWFKSFAKPSPRCFC